MKRTTILIVSLLCAASVASAVYNDFIGQPDGFGENVAGLGGLTVASGVLYKDGAPYRGVGVNYCDLFQGMIHFPEYYGQPTYRTIDGLTFLGEQKIGFVRFWVCGFWPNDWDLYFQNKNEWFIDT